MQKKIASQEFTVIIHENFFRAMPCEQDHLMWFIKQAVEALELSAWENNSQLVAKWERQQAFDADDGMDCYQWPLNVGGISRTLTICPHPRGYVMVYLEGVDDTTPVLGDEKTITFPSEFLAHAKKPPFAGGDGGSVMDGQSRSSVKWRNKPTSE